MITPIELHNRQHKTGRGYKKQEMDMFLEEVFENYEKLYKENVELKDKISRLSDGVQQYKTMETALQKALVLAEKTSKDTIESANSKALVIEKEAKLKADTIINNALSKSEEIKKQCILLLQQYTQFKAQYKQIALKQIELLDGDFYEIYSKDLIDAVNEASKSDKKTVSETETTVSGLENVEEVLQKTAKDPEEITEEPENAAEELQKTTEEPEKAAAESQKAVKEPEKAVAESQKTVKEPEKTAPESRKTAKEPEKTASESRKTVKELKKPVVEIQNAEEKSQNMETDSANTDIPAKNSNASKSSLADHIDRAIKIGSDMTENKDAATPIKNVNGDTKEFTPIESQAINRASQAEPDAENDKAKDNDDEINNSLRKLRSQLASDRKLPDSNSSFEFFE